MCNDKLIPWILQPFDRSAKSIRKSLQGVAFPGIRIQQSSCAFLEKGPDGIATCLMMMLAI